MWKYEISVVWKEGKIGSTHAGGKPSIEIATPPEFGGPENIWTPEDLLTSAVASCILTSTLFFADRAGIQMRSYMSNATATMEKTPRGLAFTRIDVEISITLENPAQADAMRRAVEQAEKNCPISTSLKCPVEISLHIENELNK